MTVSGLLQLAAELRKRAAAAKSEEEKRDLLFLAEEYEAEARRGAPDKLVPFSVRLPK